MVNIYNGDFQEDMMAEDGLAPSTSSTHLFHYGFPGGTSGKEHACQCRRQVRDVGSIPALGRSPGGGHGNALQYSCLENSIDRGAWWVLQSIGSCSSHIGFSFFALLTYNALPWFRAFTLTLPSARTTPAFGLAGAFSFFIHRDYVLDFWSPTLFIRFTKLYLKAQNQRCSLLCPPP